MTLKNYLVLNKQIIFIGLIVLLIIGTLLVIIYKRTASDKPPLNPDPAATAWQTYDEQVNNGDIEPAIRVLDVGISYKENNIQQLAVTKFTRRNGYVPSVIPEDHNYRLQLLDAQQNVLSEQFFSIQTVGRIETFNEDGTIQAAEAELPEVTVSTTLRWQPEGVRIRVVDSQGRVVVTEPITSVEDLDNKPSFNSVKPQEFFNPTQPEQLNLLMPLPAHAQTNDGKIDFVFISNAYTDQNDFQSEIDRIGKLFFEKFEPFKTRASQFRFNGVFSTDDHGCIVNATTNGLTCNKSLVIEQVQRSGVPYDVIVVMHNDSNPQIRGSADAGVIALHRSVSAPYSVAHEIGHTLGNLVDEYENSQLQAPVDNRVRGKGDLSKSLDQPNLRYPPGEGNCFAGVPPAPEWNNLQPPVTVADYRQGCIYPNWYSPSTDSIMRSSRGTQTCFNTVSQRIINKRLDALVGPFPGGPVPIVPCNSSPASISVSEPPQNRIVPTFQCLGGRPCAPTPTPQNISPAMRQGI